MELWDNNMKEEIRRANGSIQHIDKIPEDIKELYKTVWEMSMKDIIDMARHRGYFIDQSQSLNLFMQDADYAKLTSMHFYGWKSGLKTGMYYLRTKSAVNAIQFTLSKEKKKTKWNLVLYKDGDRVGGKTKKGKSRLFKKKK